MANLCSFKMRLRGERENIEKFHKAMMQEGDIWMGRGADADIEYDDGQNTATIWGTCKWSVISALIDNAISMRAEPKMWNFGKDEWNKLEFVTLWEACEKWQLDMEVYSEECGFEFQEHFGYINGGEITYDECVDWQEYDVDDYETKEEAEEELEEKFTDEEWNNQEDGRICRGGFPSWNFDF